MILTLLSPRKALNKAFLKVKPNRSDIESFKRNLIKLLDQINESESEEFHKNIISDFLKDTYYKDNHFINTKGRNDLVIHNGKDAKSSVGVIIEAKKPANKSEMMRTDNINTKAFQELILYYLRERVVQKNLEIKYLIVTNIYEWFIFDAQLFERLFANNKQLIKKFTDFEEKRLSDIRTDFFYKEIAEPFINAIETEITFTHFDIRNYEKPLRNADKQDDNILIALYKLLSPEHLLKLPFTNDSNSLDKSFYTELLHIIGLVETKEGGKKLIGRKKEGERNIGSLMESAIVQLESLDKISRLEKAHRFGATNNERLFNVALELSIIWINRILFLKLLEAQLINYNKGDKSFSFLNLERVRNYDDLNSLFFQVLARKPEERSEQTKKLFAKVPYLNSSLFEPTEIEHNGLFISQLKDTELPILRSTVLKDKIGKKRTGSLYTLEYLFEFLDAYDFAGEGAEEIQEDNKTLINASVLGLIFEKINGYKDGSFFTPGFITMYMCRETVRRAVVQKFNDAKKWNCQDINQLYDKIEDKKEANAIINSLKICDPAVGSGHFLVSALNEIISIKNDLKILSDREGKRLKEYFVEVVSDELIVTDEDGKIFEYNPQNNESRRIQETLFHEKQTVIENCLFGVDINPNSVKICRLRLWIELLKNAYYKSPNFTELETLPNIDINIKCGNSLISRYALDAEIKEALRRSKWSIDSYRLAVMTYRNAENKSQKQAMEKLIDEIKSNFESEVAAGDKRVVRLKNLKDDLKTHAQQTHIFGLTKAEKAAWEAKLKKLTAEIIKREAELEEIKNNKIYENAFEWRFEFPEVLNDDGDFIGFDVVIGNPPYMFGGNEGISTNAKELFKQTFISGLGKINLFTLFIEQSFNIMRDKGKFSFIIPNTFLRVTSYHESRKLLIDNHQVYNIYDFGNSVFDDAITTAIVIIASKCKANKQHRIVINNNGQLNEIEQISVAGSNYIISINIDGNKNKLIQKLHDNSFALGSICKEMIFGVVITKNKDEVVSNNPNDGWKPFLEGKDIGAYYIKPIHSYLNYTPNLLHRARTKEVFEANEKLLVQRITGGLQPLKVAYDDNKYYNKESINNIILEQNCPYNAKYILALVNSRLINWFYANRFTNESKLTVNLSKEYLSQIPIARASEDDQNNIMELVNQILAAKSKDSNADTNALEKEIDQLVYQFYGLTEEDIKIVEQN
jgi:adenine-specific DNA-methyltransferase